MAIGYSSHVKKFRLIDWLIDSDLTADYRAECLSISEYEKKLKAAGVPCELHLANGAVHGFCTNPGYNSRDVSFFQLFILDI